MNSRWTNVGIALILSAFLATPAGVGLPPVVAAPNSAEAWQMVGQIGGETKAVAVQGIYAYVGVGLRMIVLDISSLSTPTEVGSTPPFSYFVEDIAVSGTLAFVAAGKAGLRVVDISDPFHPTELGAWDSPGNSEGVAVAGTTVFLADGPYGLRVLDASNPAKPTPVGSAYEMNYAFKVTVSSHYAYLAAAGAGLLVVDVSNPAHPVEVGGLDTPGYASGIAVSGTTIYIADRWGGVRLVDIANPARLDEIGSYKTPGQAFGVAISGTRVYVADAFMGLQVLDFSDPNHPVGLGGYEPPYGNAAGVRISGNVAYVADRNWGLRLVDVSDPANLVEVSAFKSMVSVEAVEVVGNLAYVVSSGIGLRIADVTDSAHPRWLGATDIANPHDWGLIESVAIVGGYAYVGVGNRLFVADISDPTHPTWTESIGLKGLARDITVAGGVAYVADEGGMQLVDISIPAHPALLGRIELSTGEGHTRNIAVSGPLTYVAVEGDGLQIIDVSDPNNPQKIEGISACDHPLDVSVVGNWAYVVNQGGLSIVDVSNPAEQQEVSHLQTAEPRRVTVSGSSAYIADGGLGLSVVDVSDPYHPIYAANYDTLGYSLGVTLTNNRVYLADGQNGLVIFEKDSAESAFTIKVEDLAGQIGSAMQMGTNYELPYSHLSGLEQNTPDAATGLSPKSLQSADPFGERGNQVVRPTTGTTSTCVVSSLADSGLGTLRGCLASIASGDTITFDPTVFPPSSPVTIKLNSELPYITQGNITIDGSNAGVILDGSALTGAVFGGPDGLRIVSNGNTVRGLQIYSFPSDGVEIDGNENTIGGDNSQGNGPVGQGNVLSGNGCAGVSVQGDNNVLEGDLIGTDVTGTGKFGNIYPGVGIGGSGNIIGRADPRYRNIISGNVQSGIQMGPGASNNHIMGNYVGTDITGMASLGNNPYGITMENGAFNNLVEGNLVSGNRISGILVCGWGSDFNTIIDNLVGTDANGMKAIPNNGSGVQVASGAAFNRIGGTATGEANLISGNNEGISVTEQGQGNLVLGNLIGTTVNGDAALGNGLGVQVVTSDAGTMVGGSSQSEGNLVSGNTWIGIYVKGNANFVIGNRVGTNASGGGSVPNYSHGVSLVGEHNMVQGNQLGYSIQGNGVLVGTGSYNTIRRNSIYSNGGEGIHLEYGGNQLMPAPVILSVTLSSVAGTACPGCTVEIFSDDDDEGKLYEGTTTADLSGNWILTTVHSISGPHITATATDNEGNTSEFSLFQILWKWLYLPLIRK
jgi:hypothetical protein